MGHWRPIRSFIVVGGLLVCGVAPRGHAGQPGRLFDAAPGAVAIYEYQANGFASVSLPIDASFHFTDGVPTTLTATFYKPIIGAQADGTPIYEIGSLIPLVVTATSNNGADFDGYLVESTQYMFDWHFAAGDGGGLLWSGGVGWAGGRFEETTIANVPLVPVPDGQAGDYDADDDVDGGDFLRWQSQAGAAVSPRGIGADGNRNGLVDGDDLALWQDNFGTPLDNSASPAPEPAASLLAAALVVAVASRRLVFRGARHA